MISAPLGVNNGGCVLKSRYLCLARLGFVCLTEKLKCSLRNGLRSVNINSENSLTHLNNNLKLTINNVSISSIYSTNDNRRRKIKIKIE